MGMDPPRSPSETIQTHTPNPQDQFKKFYPIPNEIFSPWWRYLHSISIKSNCRLSGPHPQSRSQQPGNEYRAVGMKAMGQAD